MILTLLKRCNSISTFKQIHSHVITHNLPNHNDLLSKLVELEDLTYSTLLFDRISHHSTRSFNIMIRGLTTTWNDHLLAFQFYVRMIRAGAKPNDFTYPSTLTALAKLKRLDYGRATHSTIFKLGRQLDLHAQNSLIMMYARCASLGCARKVFGEIPHKDLISWNSMISGYAKMGSSKEAVEIFERMRAEGFAPSERTVVSVLMACGDLGDLNLGRSLEDLVKQKGMRLTTHVGSSLIHMYGKGGDLESARRVFDSMLEKERIAWNAMITVYSQNGRAEEAIALFQDMKDAGIEPDKITMVGILSASASVGVLDVGKWIDSWASDKGFLTDIYIGTGLVDMYGKCGKLDRAAEIFQLMPCKNKVTWNAMICALASHGRANEALSLFASMKNERDIHPDEVTFIGVLSACVHAGWVDEGCRLLYSMTTDFGVTPGTDHYSCIVDLLGRAGHVEEAWSCIERMPCQPDAAMLGALLGACRNHKNAEVGEKVSKRLLELEPSNSGNYVISSKIYARSNKWDDSAKVRGLMRDRGVMKTPGSSWVEIFNQLHEFRSGDGSQMVSKDISQMMDLLNGEMKREGYKPNVDFF